MKAGAILGVALVAAGCVGKTEYYANSEETLVAAGKFRTDYAPADVLFDNEDLKRNFVEIALFREFASNTAKKERTEGAIGRWNGPVQFSISGEDVQSEDISNINALMARLSELTGLETESVTSKQNFSVFILDDQEREELLAVFAEEHGKENNTFRRAWDQRRSLPCVAQIFHDASGNIGAALILIKAEVKGLFRLACIQEEIVQSFGLTNDGFDVRPSIFNDDAEFVMMTEHDETLMRMLYDARLSSGMKADEVKPLLDDIIADVRSEAPS